jgi:hypothetical protein
VNPDVAAPGRFRPHRVRSVDSALERHGNESRCAGGAT